MGGAVAALVVAVLTLAIPALGVSLGLWFFLLLTNIPGIGLGVTALAKVPDTAEVERFLRYTWACNLAYVAMSVVFLVPVLVLVAVTAYYS
ncbi:hypothetical protein [Nocardiopsis sp. FIRDI 009]|uniref:hypothetical protein n=1 Tax=Nocardiopsis sp. FIRDI 009 TaxID=714197 RepID=UPI000E232EEA|nr:hypothetical protein [Nocardiopsis sp. FIRDI 009]